MPVGPRITEDFRHTPTESITVVLGDYYIFAEEDEFSMPKRLVRDFSINSRGDLESMLTGGELVYFKEGATTTVSVRRHRGELN